MNLKDVCLQIIHPGSVEKMNMEHLATVVSLHLSAMQAPIIHSSWTTSVNVPQYSLPNKKEQYELWLETLNKRRDELRIHLIKLRGQLRTVSDEDRVHIKKQISQQERQFHAFEIEEQNARIYYDQPFFNCSIM